MTGHIVGVRDLTDWEFEQIVCSSFPKKLSVKVWPANEHMYFKVYNDGELVECFNSMSKAIDFYNQM